MLGVVVGFVASAQVTITGTVVDENGIELGGAVVVADGNKTQTDFDGKFVLEVPKKATQFSVSYLRYETVTLDVPAPENNHEDNIQLKPQTGLRQAKVERTKTKTKINTDSYKFALKTNVLYDFTGTINFGVELPVAPHWTVDLSTNINDWDVYNKKSFRHILIQPEARYWFDSNFAGHFVALHTHYARYNMGNFQNDIRFLGTNFCSLSDRAYNGWLLGLGVGYGYVFNLYKNLNLELELGLGYAYMEYNTYALETLKWGYSNTHNYWGITKLNVGLTYCF